MQNALSERSESKGIASGKPPRNQRPLAPLSLTTTRHPPPRPEPAGTQRNETENCGKLRNRTERNGKFRKVAERNGTIRDGPESRKSLAAKAIYVPGRRQPRPGRRPTAQPAQIAHLAAALTCGCHSLLAKLCSFHVPSNTVCEQTVPPHALAYSIFSRLGSAHLWRAPSTLTAGGSVCARKRVAIRARLRTKSLPGRAQENLTYPRFRARGGVPSARANVSPRLGAMPSRSLRGHVCVRQALVATPARPYNRTHEVGRNGAFRAADAQAGVSVRPQPPLHRRPRPAG